MKEYLANHVLNAMFSPEEDDPEGSGGQEMQGEGCAWGAGGLSGAAGGGLEDDEGRGRGGACAKRLKRGGEGEGEAGEGGGAGG